MMRQLSSQISDSMMTTKTKMTTTKTKPTTKCTDTKTEVAPQSLPRSIGLRTPQTHTSSTYVYTYLHQHPYIHIQIQSAQQNKHTHNGLRSPMSVQYAMFWFHGFCVDSDCSLLVGWASALCSAAGLCITHPCTYTHTHHPHMTNTQQSSVLI